ncbi:hypothetical protein Dimus_015564, partial [Dionaea muscipula]
VLNILDYGLAKIADLFIKHATSPATNLRSPTTFVVESNNDSRRSFEAIVQMVPCSDSKVLSNDDPRFGYEVATGRYEDLMAAGIIDPTKVYFLFLMI